MGYQTRMVAVDLAALKAAIGSEDASLHAAIVAAQADAIAEMDEWFEDEIARGAPNVAVALEALIHGRPLVEQHGFAYGYALELLCNQLGDEVGDPEGILPFLCDLKIASDLIKDDHRLPVAIPKPADFPGIGYLTRDEMRRAIEAFSAIASDFDEDDPESVFTAALQEALDLDRDVVTFTY